MVHELTLTCFNHVGQDLYEEVRQTPGLSITFLEYSSYSEDEGCFEGGSPESFIEDLRRMGAKKISAGTKIQHFQCLLCGEPQTSALTEKERGAPNLSHYCDANPNGPGKKLNRRTSCDQFILVGESHLPSTQCEFCKPYRSPHLP